jgi:hypothetical protein
MRTIPCAPTGQSNWQQRTTLGGRDYVLRFDWHQRTGGWYLGLYDQDDAPIAVGLRLVVHYPLLRGVVDPRRPPGQIVVADLQGLGDVDPGFADLGTRFLLLHLEPLDIQELG